MPEDLRSSEGRIGGRTPQDNSAEGKISGATVIGVSANSGGKILGNKDVENGPEENIKQPLNNKFPTTRKQRIGIATEKNGLESLPLNFGDTDGDWRIIESDDLFEILFLDYEQVNIISPEIVKKNYGVLEKFWKEKKNLWESGSGQVRKNIEDKYGANNLSNCLKKIQYALEQLFTLEKIGEYYSRLKEQRLQQGALKLDALLKFMVKDGEADPNEIEGIIEEGILANLNAEEVAVIIKRAIDAKGFKPYGNPTGKLLSEQLLSVSWMNENNISKKKAEDEEKQRRGREIFDNIYAFSTEEIGTIIFNHEKEAKRDIADGLLKNSIDYFSPAKARQFVDIINTQKNAHLQYLQIAYRLNAKLPYRFNSSIIVKTPEELVNVMAQTSENLKAGKEQFKKGYLEVWLLETNKIAYQKLKKIWEDAENADIAFIEFIYTFNPALPNRFNDTILVHSQEQLCVEIDKDNNSWEAGKRELFDSSIPVWLSVAKKSSAAAGWNKVKTQFNKNKDLGLEYFLHLLIPGLPVPKLSVNHETIEYPKIQSGQTIKTPITFTNTSRGYIEASIELDKNLLGVSLSNNFLQINNCSGNTSFETVLTIDSSVLLKGVNYQLKILVKTSVNDEIIIPISFKIVFPKNEFWKRTIIFAFIGAAFFGLIRVMLASAYPNWLNDTFQAFLDWHTFINNQSFFWLFGLTFFLFITALVFSIFFLIKYMRKK
jgi:hypothetical protein